MKSLLVLLAYFCVQAPAHADDPRPVYEMRGTYTDVWPHDAGYFAQPLVLKRTRGTFDLHRVDFEAMRYQEECVSWQQVCVDWAPNGECRRWENRCVRTEFRGYPVQKRIELDFGAMPDLAEGQEELYELAIIRQRPGGVGEDWVDTWLRAEVTTVPTRVMRFGEYRYEIRPK
jgi:hypothetical protein